jgi:hypothetical protein
LAGPVALFSCQPAEGRQRGQEHLVVAQKRLGLRDQGGEVIEIPGKGTGYPAPSPQIRT